MKRFLDLKHRDCRWPLGGLMEKPEFFCGAPRDDIKPYCAEHARSARVGAPKPLNPHVKSFDGPMLLNYVEAGFDEAFA